MPVPGVASQFLGQCPELRNTVEKGRETNKNAGGHRSVTKGATAAIKE
jgi:hypothetical protein